MKTRAIIASKLYVDALKKSEKFNKEVHHGIANVVLEKTKMIIPYEIGKIWAKELGIEEE